MTSQNTNIDVFQPFRLAEALIIPQLNEIHRAGRICRVERQVMLLLVHLAENVGQAVTRDALFAALWADSCSGDEAITQAVSKLRKALGDKPGKGAIVQTVRKVGYRLNGPILSAIGQSTETRADVPVTLRRANWKWVAAAALAWVTLVHGGVRVEQSSGHPSKVHAVRMIIPDEGSIRFERGSVVFPSADSLSSPDMVWHTD